MLNDLKNAFKCFQKTIQKQPSNFDCLINLGNCYVTWNQPDKALIYYLKAVIVNVKAEMPFKSIGCIFKQKNNYHCALDFYNHCLFLNPKDVQILLEVSMIYLINNNTEKGVLTLKKLLEIDPTNQMGQIMMHKLKEEKWI